MDFSERNAMLYVSLGYGEPQRRACSVEGFGTPTSVERFLGSRMQGFTAVVRIERGDGFVRTASGQTAISPGDVIVMPPGGVLHGFRGPHRVEMLALPVGTATGAVVRASHLPRDLFAYDDAHVMALLRDAPHRQTIARTAQEAALARALDWIARDPWSARLSRVSHALGYTCDGLATLMRRATGNGFAHWRDALAMAAARDALVSHATVAGAAETLAADPQYFHRRFARAHRATPRRWRGQPTMPPDAVAHYWDAVARHVRG